MNLLILIRRTTDFRNENTQALSLNNQRVHPYISKCSRKSRRKKEREIYLIHGYGSYIGSDYEVLAFRLLPGFGRSQGQIKTRIQV